MNVSRPERGCGFSGIAFHVREQNYETEKEKAKKIDLTPKTGTG